MTPLRLLDLLVTSNRTRCSDPTRFRTGGAGLLFAKCDICPKHCSNQQRYGRDFLRHHPPQLPSLPLGEPAPHALEVRVRHCGVQAWLAHRTPLADRRRLGGPSGEVERRLSFAQGVGVPVRPRQQPVFEGPWELVGVVRHHRRWGQWVHSHRVRVRCCTIVASACQGCGRGAPLRVPGSWACVVACDAMAARVSAPDPWTSRKRDASRVPQPPPGGTGPLGCFSGFGGRPDPSQCGVGPRARCVEQGADIIKSCLSGSDPRAGRRPQPSPRDTREVDFGRPPPLRRPRAPLACGAPVHLLLVPPSLGRTPPLASGVGPTHERRENTQEGTHRRHRADAGAPPEVYLAGVVGALHPRPWPLCIRWRLDHRGSHRLEATAT